MQTEEQMTPRAKAVLEAVRIFKSSRGYGALWDALVGALEFRYRHEQKKMPPGDGSRL